jgi:hypothetical protein
MKPPEVWRKLEEVWQNRSGSESNSFGETFFSLDDKNKKNTDLSTNIDENG